MNDVSVTKTMGRAVRAAMVVVVVVVVCVEREDCGEMVAAFLYESQLVLRYSMHRNENAQLLLANCKESV